ncbi:radiation-inducible immediate-early gene IEX-1 [Cetorhinus maximus]
MCPRNAGAQSQPLCPKRLPRPQGEIFTFDTESPRAMSRCQPSRSSRRPRRILYPAAARRYLPRRQRDHIKTWLLVLGAVVALQIYWEQPAPLAGEGELSSPGGTGLPVNSSHTGGTEPDNTPAARGCAYLELYMEAAALRL